MARSLYLAASGVVQASAGELVRIQISKVGSADSSVIVYDNPAAASGTVIARYDGAIAGPFFDFTADGENTPFSTGCYIALAGTTVPAVNVIVK
jgi:hypothetical protein